MTTQAKEFQDYKHNYYATKGSSLNASVIDPMFAKLVDNMKVSYAEVLDNTISNLKEKQYELRTLTQQKVMNEMGEIRKLWNILHISARFEMVIDAEYCQEHLKVSHK